MPSEGNPSIVGGKAGNGRPLREKSPPSREDLYDRLMSKVNPAIKGKKLASVSFVWMQGERDAEYGVGRPL